MFFKWSTEKKKICFGTTRSLFSLSTAHTKKNLWEKNRKKTGENILCIENNKFPAFSKVA